MAMACEHCFKDAPLTASQAATINADPNVSNDCLNSFLLTTHLLVGWIPHGFKMRL